MVAASNIRLPGVYFLPPPRVGGVDLPPLDVAAFVGFAERGPLDMPVAITDLDTYRAVFGGEMVVAREPKGGTVYAALPMAVANFFVNGGRRCYVVRVAGKRATTTRFRIPRMIAISASSGTPKLVPIRASSAGRWSQQLRIGARLLTTPLPVSAFSVTPDRQISWLTGSAPDAIQIGDVLRLTFADESQWLFPVTSIEMPANAEPRDPLKLVANFAWQTAGVEFSSPPASVAQVRRLTTTDLEPLDVMGTLSLAESETEFDMDGSDVDDINSGDVLHLEMSDHSQFLFAVSEVSGSSAGISPPGPRVAISKTPLIRLPAGTLAPPASPSLMRVERLRFDLLLRQGKSRLRTLADLSFNAGPNRWDGNRQRRGRLTELAAHSRPTRFWGEVALLESSALYLRAADVDGKQTAQSTRLFRLLETDERIEEAHDGNLDITALAGLLAPAEDQDATYLPLGMDSILAEEDLVGPDPNEVGDDDLESFDASLFVDPFLVPQLNNQRTSSEGLINEAFDRHYVQDKRLRGMHSLMFIDEVALISTPEAIHRGWELQFSPVFSPPVTSPPITSLPEVPVYSEFHDCNLPIRPDPPAAETPIPTEPRLPIVMSVEDYEIEAMLEIQQAMLNFCQARRDVTCVLTLPLHFEKRQCIEWQEKFRQQLGLGARRSAFSSESTEISDLSYAAVFHPWLLQRDASSPDGLRRVACDGAVCGIIAARERARQVWVAPANVPLRMVLGLTPVFNTDDWADLFDLQFNLVRAEPSDFRLMSAHTLSDEAILLQVSVRRLMILLRKVVVERGMDFVFESNHQRFREAVKLMLERILRFMFERGAFAGATPEQSYRVVTDSSVNPPESVDAGRFIAQIQVAPSQPMEFITVLLTRIGEDLLQAAEA